MSDEDSMVEPPSPKVPYEKPRLLVFGDVRELTLSVGKNSKADGGTGSMSKSSP